MASNFPNSPSLNATFTDNGLTFVWNGEAWKLNSSSGTKGEKGQKGEVGVTGDKGQKGEKGEVGTKGQKGEIGATGGTGGTGSKGQKGEVGETGAAGAAASKGQKGEAGDKGATGGTGGTGSTGDKGQKGEASTVKGDKGQKGEIGSTGDKGATGAGDKGQKGEEGPQGGGAPVGQIVAWSGSAGSLPSGYFLCDGSAISRSTYAALFAIVGTTHGSGNGSSTFNIPDLRDRFVVGSSNSTGDTTYPGVSPGATGGSANAVLVSHTHNLQNHVHGINLSTNNPGDHDHNVDVLAEFASTHGTWQTGGGYRQVHTGGTHRKPITSDAGGHTHTVSGNTGTPSTNTTDTLGESATNKNLPPYYALAYIIQYAQGGSTAKGQKGEQGATGSGGSTGDKGQKGEVGDKGAASSVQGPTGDKGQKGATGATGGTGGTGSTGAKGQKGEVGSTGDKGQKGEIGSTGSTGSAGSDGSDGAKGQKGEVGATGSAASYTVKQVLSTSTNGTQYYRYYQGPIDTGLSLTINCADANNKILIEYTICCAATVGNASLGGGRYVGSRLLRNNSQIAAGSGGGSGNESVYTDTGLDSLDHHSFSYMDTPGAGNHTYKVQIRHHLGGSYSNYLVFNRSRDGNYRTMSTLTCSEIEI